MPIRPLGLARDLLHAVPGETIAADAHAVADRAPVTENVIKMGVGGVDDQRSRRLLGGIGDFLPAQFRRQLRGTGFRLFIRRQRGQHHRTAIGPHGGGCTVPVTPVGAPIASGGRKRVGSIVAARMWAADGSKDAGGGGWNKSPAAARRMTITRIIRRKHRTCGVPGRNKRAGPWGGHSADRWAKAPDRAAAARSNSARSAPRHPPKRQNPAGPGAAAIVAGITAGRIRGWGRRINRTRRNRVALLSLRQRGSRRARHQGSTNRQTACDHHRSCIVPKPTPDR